MNQRASQFVQRGHTILEVLISMGLISILMLGLASAIEVARQSLPNGTSPASAALVTSEALARFTADVRYATIITTHLPNELEFKVPDRNGDNADETIRYRWSGTPGAPLTRQVNGSANESLVKSVDQFNLIYNTRLDPDLGLQLRSLDISLLTSGNTARIEANVRILNDPTLP
jgi:type II secretory pathway pseudopilin PulG